jgi:hypothetical protein
VDYGPETAEEAEVKRKQDEELQRKKSRIEEGEGYHSVWPDQPREESSDKSDVQDAVGD